MDGSFPDQETGTSQTGGETGALSLGRLTEARRPSYRRAARPPGARWDAGARAGKHVLGGLEQRSGCIREPQGTTAQESQPHGGGRADGEWAGETRAPTVWRRLRERTWTWVCRPGTRPGLPSLAGTGGRMGGSNRGEQKSEPACYQGWVTLWAASLPQRSRPDSRGWFLKFPPVT